MPNPIVLHSFVNFRCDIISSDGLYLESVRTIADSFEMQSKLNPRLTKNVGHISLNFSAQDRELLINENMAQIATDYLDQMGIRDTQFMVARHLDKEHPHCHIIYNRVGNDGQTISDRNERLRSTQACRELTDYYDLYIAPGKANVKRERLRASAKTKYAIYDSLRNHIKGAKSWPDLQRGLQGDGIEVHFRRNKTDNKVVGVQFSKCGVSFSGSKVDKRFGFQRIVSRLQRNIERGQSQHSARTSSYDSKLAALDAFVRASLRTQGVVASRSFSDDDDEEDEYGRKIKRRGMRM